MATQIEKWVSFDDDDKWEGDHEDALSLSDLPLVVDYGEISSSSDSPTCSPLLDLQDAGEFEFRAFGGGGGSAAADPDGGFLIDMCAADEVFFQGQILPKRPSSACSRSESMDRCCSTNGSSLTFDSSSSSGTISRSDSTDSSASNSRAGNAPPRLSVSSNFFTGHPCPRPHLPSRKSTAGPRMKSTSSSSGGRAPAVLGLLRLGVVRAPQMELHELRQPRKGSSGNGSSRWSRTEERKSEKKKKPEAPARGSSTGSSHGDALRQFGNKLSCKCSPGDAVEPILSSSSSSSTPLIDHRRKKKDENEGSGSRRHRDEPTCHSSNRTFHWMEDLYITKATSSA